MLVTIAFTLSLIWDDLSFVSGVAK